MLFNLSCALAQNQNSPKAAILRFGRWGGEGGREGQERRRGRVSGLEGITQKL